MVESAEPDIVSPAIAANDPDRLADQGVRDAVERLPRADIEIVLDTLTNDVTQFLNSHSLRLNAGFAEEVGVEQVMDQLL